MSHYEQSDVTLPLCVWGGGRITFQEELGCPSPPTTILCSEFRKAGSLYCFGQNTKWITNQELTGLYVKGLNIKHPKRDGEASTEASSPFSFLWSLILNDKRHQHLSDPQSSGVTPAELDLGSSPDSNELHDLRQVPCSSAKYFLLFLSLNKNARRIQQISF